MIKNFDEFINENINYFLRKTFNPNVDELLEKLRKKVFNAINSIKKSKNKVLPQDIFNEFMNYFYNGNSAVSIANKIYKKIKNLEDNSKIMDIIIENLKLLRYYLPLELDIEGNISYDNTIVISNYIEKYNKIADKIDITKINKKIDIE